MPVPIVPIGLAAKFGMPAAAGIGTGMATGMGLMNQLGDKVDAARGYITGYDTKQTPFEVAKERGLAGVVGGTIDAATGGMTDFDKRGDSKKQKDTKKFLKQFVYGTDGMIKKADPVQIDRQMRQGNPAGAMPGFEFPDSKSYVPGKTKFGGFS